ncbi:hypothetical protein CDAR_551461 [Caerostris darwini]|uniref:Uncharacterized protein n=1 Tax=Caerostris darwini TaxID=1538125 RepID=A0AAV4V5V7_9ARAC|nr:hypothetical protein CDAR_551461 [Caerostris darwini]
MARKMEPQFNGIVFGLFSGDLIDEIRNFFSKWRALGQRCEKESFEEPEAIFENPRTLTTPERTSRRQAPSPLTETESTSSRSIMNVYPGHDIIFGPVFFFALLIWLLLELKEYFANRSGPRCFSNWSRGFIKRDILSERRNCEKESFEVSEAGVQKETLLMTAVDQEGHISSLGSGKRKSCSEQKRS